MVNEQEETKLLDLVRNGDQQALEELLSLVQPRLYRFSMKMCQHPEDAEDVLQDSMLSLARYVKDFRGESRFSTWLFTVARSFCIKQRRKSKFAPKQHLSLESVTDSVSASGTAYGTDPLRQVEHSEVWQEVQAGIAALEPHFREVLVLRDVEGLSAKEVAAVTGQTVSAVKSRLHRARVKLRDNIGNAKIRTADCPDIRRVFSQYVEGELSSDVCAKMQDHVLECAICKSECDQLKEQLELCSQAPCEVPIEVQERVKQSLRSHLDGVT